LPISFRVYDTYRDTVKVPEDTAHGETTEGTSLPHPLLHQTPGLEKSSPAEHDECRQGEEGLVQPTDGRKRQEGVEKNGAESTQAISARWRSSGQDRAPPRRETGEGSVQSRERP
jgi:hypothetical protein